MILSFKSLKMGIRTVILPWMVIRFVPQVSRTSKLPLAACNRWKEYKCENLEIMSAFIIAPIFKEQREMGAA